MRRGKTVKCTVQKQSETKILRYDDVGCMEPGCLEFFILK